jgi:hypothetical protein
VAAVDLDPPLVADVQDKPMKMPVVALRHAIRRFLTYHRLGVTLSGAPPEER